MYLVRKAYGQDIVKREAAVLKRLEFGLISASLQRTFDDLILEPGVNLSIMQAALVQRETQDDPGKYQAYITQERENDKAKKPKQPSAANIAKEVVKEVVAKSHCAEAAERASAHLAAPRDRDSGKSRGRGRGQGNARSRGSGSGTRGRGSAGRDGCTDT